ncbi:MAG: hypothetical protein QW705_06575 [Zestosphaera sp.]
MNEEKGKKKLPFPMFLFIGMGIGFMLIPISPFAFIASLFVGMGLGFLLSEIIVVEEKRIRAEFPVRMGGIASMLIGLVFIAGGLLSIIAPKLLEQYATVFIGLGFIVTGLFIFLYGLELLKLHPSS